MEDRLADDRRDDRRLERQGDRREAILRTLVEEHIRSGEPVSSRAILDSTGLTVSAATIRGELAALDREGYAIQPHTSAGRIPTAKAYRYYVEHLTPARLRGGTQHRIAHFFDSVQFELGRLLKATTELLSEITHYPAVVVGPGPVGEEVKALHLVQLGAKTALVVVVTRSGRVGQELVRLSEPVTTTELEAVERVMATRVVGSALDELGSVDVELGRLPVGSRPVAAEMTAGLGRVAAQTAEIYVGGTHQMATVWDNLSTVHRVLEVLEREAVVLEILARVPGTSIRIGDELTLGDDVAVVSSSFDTASGAGRVGVIGPIRMDYRRVISEVEGVSRELGDRIGS